jgi:hypothetical protein
MALQITVTFPCSDEEYRRSLIILNAMHKSDFTAPISQPKSAAVEPSESVLEELTEDELALLDFQLGQAHNSNETPVLNSFESEEVPTLKVNRSREIIKFFEKYPGAPKYECVDYLAVKLAEFYPSRDIAERRLKVLIGQLVIRKLLINKNGTYFLSER